MNLTLTAETNTSPLVSEHMVPFASESRQDLRDVGEFMMSEQIHPVKRRTWMRLRLATTSTVFEHAFTPTMSPAASGIVWIPEDEFSPITTRTKEQEKLWRIKREHFTSKGREQRIKTALSALEEAVVDYQLDAETVHWLALDVDAEDM